MVSVDPDVTAVAADGAGADRPKRGRLLVFGVVAIALLMVSIDQTSVATALPSIQRDLQTSLAWSGWTITVYSLGQIIGMPVAGKLSDQFGRKAVFMVVVGVFTLASLCAGLVHDIDLLIALRAVQGLAGGGIVPSATGIVSDQFGHDRDRAIGMFTSIFPIGAIIGPIVGGVLVTYSSWRAIFLINLPLGVVMLALTAVLISRSPRRRTGRPGRHQRHRAAGRAVVVRDDRDRPRGHSPPARRATGGTGRRRPGRGRPRPAVPRPLPTRPVARSSRGGCCTGGRSG